MEFKGIVNEEKPPWNNIEPFMDEIVIFIPQIICFVRMCSYMDGSMQCYPYVASSIQCCCHLDFLEYLKTKGYDSMRRHMTR